MCIIRRNTIQKWAAITKNTIQVEDNEILKKRPQSIMKHMYFVPFKKNLLVLQDNVSQIVVHFVLNNVEMRFLKDSIIVSLKQAVEASRWIEKLIWIFLGVVGSAYFAYLLVAQVNSWDENSILVSKQQRSIDEIDFPAITFCAQGSTRYAIAERIGNAMHRESSFVKKKLMPVRNELIKAVVNQKLDYAEKYYQNECVNEDHYHFFNSKSYFERYCTVSPKRCLILLTLLIHIVSPFQRSKLLYEYATTNNMSYSALYEDLMEELLQTWNISRAVEKFYKQRVGNNSEVSNMTIKFETKDEWNDFYTARMIIGSESEFDWYPENVGSFFINRLLETFRNRFTRRPEDKVSISDQFDTAFTIPEMNISILNFANLHTTNDFKQLLVSEDIAKKLKSFTLESKMIDVKDYLANFPSSFYECFEQEKLYFEKTSETNLEIEETYMLKSPCIEIRHLNNCAEYCQWSKESEWSQFFADKEFSNLMKYALPQANVPNKQGNSEYELMSKIVGKESLKKKPKIAPVPLVILCKYQKYHGWEGQDIGMDVKFCDSFVEVPSDVGICASGAMNTEDIFNSNIYVAEENSRKIQGGTYFSEATIFLNNGADFHKIQMQIHPRTELAQILHELNQDHATRSFTLKKGHEYNFEVSIDGRMITENFRELPIDERKCKLQDEVDANSWFKFYSKRQCKYKCRTLLAYNTCGCIPWDIFHHGSYPECDIFGRTCFMNVIENITLTKGQCEDCHNDCQYLRYRYKVTENVIKDHVKFSSDGCSGIKALCNYLEDKNHTLYNKYSSKRNSVDKRRRFKAMIAVNIVFPISEVDLTVLDVRYTLIDKITSLGGSFGLFTQFTGCSIIAVIHLIILTIKQICIFCKDLKSKFCHRNE